MRVTLATSLDDALASMAADNPPTPIAGGTDLLVSWHQRPHDDLDLLDLSRLGELRRMRLTVDQLEIGALATYWDVISSHEVSAAFPLLAEAARQIGAIQIQTRGTWAGNIANGSPAADGVPVLMAYDATVVLQSRAGVVEVPLDAYYTGYKRSVKGRDQLITKIRLPRRARKMEWFHKVGARAAQAIAKVGVAVVNDREGWRVVAASVAPTICRCRQLEALLNAGGRTQNEVEIREILKGDISPIDDIRSTSKYRLAALSRLLLHRLSAADVALE